MNDFTLRKCYFIYFAKFESPIDLLFVVIFTPEASSIVLGIQTGWWFRKHYYPNPTILPVLSFVLGDGLEGTAGRVAGRLAVVARAPAAVQQDNRATVGKKQTQPRGCFSSQQLFVWKWKELKPARVAGRLVIVEVAGCDSERRGKVAKCSCLLSPFTPVSLERGLPRSELGLVKKCQNYILLVPKKGQQIIFLERSNSGRKLIGVYFQKCVFCKCIFAKWTQL